MELTPRTAPGDDGGAGRPTGRGRGKWAYAALVVVLVGLGIVVWQGLTSASTYFYNADEAVEQRADLGDRRFRLQGTVQDDIVDGRDEGVAFTVAYNGVDVAVQHDGDPPELFEPGIPVVLEGQWSPDTDAFLSDRILVKHSEQYQEDNGDRIADAEDGGSTGSNAP